MKYMDRITGYSRSTGFILAACLGAACLLAACSLPAAITSERRALLIGINDYIFNTVDGFRDLEYPRKDAQTLGALLDSQGWETDDTTLIDTAATKAKIKAVMEDYFKGIPSNATALVYYSGHGTLDESNAYIVPSDYQRITPDRLVSAAELGGWIEEYILPYTKNVMLIIDACNSGGFVAESDSTDLIDPDYDVNLGYSVTTAALSGLSSFSALLAKNMEQAGSLDPIVMSAAGFKEESWESDSLQHGVFTYYLLKAAQNGDANKDGYVSATEAYTYAAKSIDKYWNDLYGNSNAFYPHITGGLRDLVLFDLN